jgi:hypothetical protein
MAASQVVLYFDKQEDALLFTLAASSVISADAPDRVDEALAKVGTEICKASRITAEGVLHPTPMTPEIDRGQMRQKTA